MKWKQGGDKTNNDPDYNNLLDTLCANTNKKCIDVFQQGMFKNSSYAWSEKFVVSVSFINWKMNRTLKITRFTFILSSRTVQRIIFFMHNKFSMALICNVLETKHFVLMSPMPITMPIMIFMLAAIAAILVALAAKVVSWIYTCM